MHIKYVSPCLFNSSADVQVQLGHSSIGTTMNIYTHIVPEQTRKTTARFLQFMDEENKPKNSTFWVSGYTFEHTTKK